MGHTSASCPKSDTAALRNKVGEGLPLYPEDKDSPTPLKTFANLTKVDELVSASGSCPVITKAKLSKSAWKKQERAQEKANEGGNAPTPP